ncbi:MAG TPA: SURF1 family protein [Acidimicrobiia bacterium]|nr:SURF1 family protein [Acidimicrobiia bacterium]
MSIPAPPRWALRGRWLAAAIGVIVVAGVCVRLGIWQLDRLDQRRDFNRRVEAAGANAPAPLDDLVPAASNGVEDGEFRRAVAEGTWDTDREMLVLSKSLVGTPGQHVVTPLLLDDGTAVLVERGFVPVVDPDARVPVRAIAPRGAVTVEGVVHQSQSGGRFLPSSDDAVAAGTIGHLTRIDVPLIDKQLPYDLRPGYLRVEAELAQGAGITPTPLPPPELGDGPHLGYAFQWFSFAVVFVAGWVVLVRRAGRRDHGATAHPDR